MCGPPIRVEGSQRGGHGLGLRCGGYVRAGRIRICNTSSWPVMLLGPLAERGATTGARCPRLRAWDWTRTRESAAAAETLAECLGCTNSAFSLFSSCMSGSSARRSEGKGSTTEGRASQKSNPGDDRDGKRLETLGESAGDPGAKVGR